MEGRNEGWRDGGGKRGCGKRLDRFKRLVKERGMGNLPRNL
jgi:hypothetical protein